MIAEIDALVQASLTSLIDDIGAAAWTGRREREVVSLFCFGHLLRYCRPGTFLHDPTQIAIEVAVPQLATQTQLTGKATSKGQVCKDVVLWPRPRMTCWNAAGAPTIRPACVLEWKHEEGDVSSSDVEWLAAFSAGSEDFVGYAVCTSRSGACGFRLSCTRVYQGQSMPRWLFLA
jgi:hypothetical protein